jgi:hypothetical protein
MPIDFFNKYFACMMNTKNVVLDQNNTTQHVPRIDLKCHAMGGGIGFSSSTHPPSHHHNLFA